MILIGSLLGNNIGEDGAKAILDVAQSKSHLTTLCGLKPDQTEADFSYKGLTVGDAVLLAYDLKQNSVLVKLEYATAHLSPTCQHPLTLQFESCWQFGVL